MRVRLTWLVLTALAIACQGCEDDISVTFDVIDADDARVEPTTVSCIAEFLPDGIEDLGNTAEGDLSQDVDGVYTCVFPDDTDIGWVSVLHDRELLEYAARRDEDVNLIVWQPVVTVEIAADALVVAWDREPLGAWYRTSDDVEQSVTVYVDGDGWKVDLPATEVRYPLGEVEDPARATISIEAQLGSLTYAIPVQ